MLGFLVLGLAVVGALLVVEARTLRASGPPEGDVDPVLADPVRGRT